MSINRGEGGAIITHCFLHRCTSGFSGDVFHDNRVRDGRTGGAFLVDRDLQRLSFFSWRRASDVVNRAEGVEKDFPEICANDGALGGIHSAGVKSDIPDAVTPVL